MPGYTPADIYVKTSLNKEEAEQLYELGREPVVWALLAFAAQLKETRQIGADLAPES